MKKVTIVCHMIRKILNILFSVLVILPVLLTAQVGVYRHKASFTNSEGLFMMEQLGGDTLLTIHTYRSKDALGQLKHGLLMRKMGKYLNVIEEKTFAPDSLFLTMEYMIPSKDSSWFLLVGRGLQLDSLNHLKRYFVSIRMSRDLDVETFHTYQIDSAIAQIGFTGRRVNDSLFVVLSYDFALADTIPRYSYLYLVNQNAELISNGKYKFYRNMYPMVDVIPLPKAEGYCGIGPNLHFFSEDLVDLGIDSHTKLGLSHQGHILQLEDSSYVAAGTYNGVAVRLIKLDKDLYLRKDTTIIPVPMPNSPVGCGGGRCTDKRPDKDIICVGVLKDFHFISNDIMQIRPDLSVRWIKYINFSEWYHKEDISTQLYDVLATRDGGCMCGGIMYVRKDGGFTGYSYIVHIDSTGRLVGNKDFPPVTYDITLYPNPSSGILHIRLEGMESSCRMQLSDIAGRPLVERIIRQGEQDFDFSGLQKGLYLYRIFDKDNRIIATGKWTRE